ncbi:DgyrCDS12140 [Dimorphilus gyrociliatus]|uniref:DgyrCDS12140 n=1 Tax=Dimorphilus gyrociliatus TaxID=2664684 RepID=A0A7I8W6U0_9ANNE|nr:DgyrCDS12140 [Dimorphilus gyrociliatus]
MELIEGVGNEVLVVVGLLLSFFVIVFAWLSTSVTDIPRHLFVFERNYMHEFILRLTNSRPVLLQTAQIDSLHEETRPVEDTTEETRETTTVSSSENTTEEARNSEQSDDPQLTEVPVEVENGNPQTVNDLRQRRIERLTKSIETRDAEPPNEEINREADNTESNTTNDESDSHLGLITVKLKFLDDRQREVRTPQTETIGEFKRKYFQEELAENEYIRFVFNGQELRQESQTLQQYNVRDNSVIHCLISRIRNEQQNGNNQDETNIQMVEPQTKRSEIIVKKVPMCTN